MVGRGPSLCYIDAYKVVEAKSTFKELLTFTFSIS